MDFVVTAGEDEAEVDILYPRGQRKRERHAVGAHWHAAVVRGRYDWGHAAMPFFSGCGESSLVAGNALKGSWVVELVTPRARYGGGGGGGGGEGGGLPHEGEGGNADQGG